MELYDPASRTWAPGQPLSDARAQHAAALLPDGNVLLVGGINAFGIQNTAERVAIDGRGTTVKPSPVFGNVTVITALSDGTILALADGSTNAYRYNPATSTWTGSVMLAQRAMPTVTTLPDGRVFVAGGTLLNSGGIRTDSTEIYNPDTNTWAAGASMTDGPNGAQAVVLADGGVLIIGGFTGSGEAASVERYQP